MKLNSVFTALAAAAFLLNGCAADVPVKKDFELAFDQTRRMLSVAEDPTLSPRTVLPDGSIHFVSAEDWTSGFFPGILWQLYAYGKDEQWRKEADKWTVALEHMRHFNGHHDIGFIINCSFGNGYALTGNAQYREVIIDAARALASRFDPRVGLIQSWDAHLFAGSQYPVIIDNMMNLELLFRASDLSGDRQFYDIAVSHADRTLENHYRSDASSFHVVDYDPETGDVRARRTAQGLSDGSAWSRGQAWGLYGFTMCYRETGDEKYLRHAERIADFILNHPNMPEDMVFYWDFDAPGIPDEPRDVSAAAVAASGLLELSKLSPEGSKYYNAAGKILISLSKPPYLSEPGANGNFILTGSTGSAPANSEVSVPLNYADYYFLEAVNRYTDH